MANKNKRIWRTMQEKYVSRRQTEEERIHERIQKKSIQQIVKIKENDELKSVEVDIVTNFIKNEVESSSGAEVYT